MSPTQYRNRSEPGNRVSPGPDAVGYDEERAVLGHSGHPDGLDWVG